MSLRAFHLFFIGLSTILAAFTAAWAGGQYSAQPAPVYAITLAGALVAGAGLALYGARFQRKTRHL